MNYVVSTKYVYFMVIVKTGCKISSHGHLVFHQTEFIIFKYSEIGSLHTSKKINYLNIRYKQSCEMLSQVVTINFKNYYSNFRTCFHLSLLVENLATVEPPNSKKKHESLSIKVESLQKFASLFFFLFRTGSAFISILIIKTYYINIPIILKWFIMLDMH